MISLTPLDPEPWSARDQYGEVEYLLRRANEETVAATARPTIGSLQAMPEWPRAIR